jgi:hypothetical protein
MNSGLFTFTHCRLQEKRFLAKAQRTESRKAQREGDGECRLSWQKLSVKS